MQRTVSMYSLRLSGVEGDSFFADHQFSPGRDGERGNGLVNDRSE